MGRRQSRAALAAGFLALAACSPRRAAEAIALADVQRATDIAYGDGPRRRLDVYRTRAARGGAPVVVFLYGGRWKSGERRDYLLLAAGLARKGWVIVVPDYRLHPAVSFPAWIEDAAGAVRWTRDHAAGYGGDTARVFVVGHSAGAHTAVMLALDERYLRAAGVSPSAVRGWVAIAGPVDTTWTDPDVQRLMGPESGWPQTYPRTFAANATRPMLLLHGADDETVGAASSVRLAERVRDGGGCARATVLPGVGHISIVLAAAIPAITRAPVRREIERFVRDPEGTACPAPPRR